MAGNKPKPPGASLEREATQIRDLTTNLGNVGQDDGKYLVGYDQYKNVTILENLYDSEGNLTGQQEKFFFVFPNGTDFRFLNRSQVIAETKKLYSNNLETLRKQLYEKNFIEKQDYQNKDEAALNEGIIKASRNSGVGEAQRWTVEGKTRFTSFLDFLKQPGYQEAGNLPVRDINLVDRDVIEAVVRGVYTKTTDMSPEDADAFIQQETDRYMDQIKKGQLTTVKQVGGEMVRKTTKGFTTAQVEAELPGRIQQQMPDVLNYKKNLNFLAFLDSMGANVL